MARNNDRDRGTRRAPKETGRRTKKKICIFCKDHATWVDYKDVNLLRKFMSDRGKIRARRVSGNCAQHQREVALAIKTAPRARPAALYPADDERATERPRCRQGCRAGPGTLAVRSPQKSQSWRSCWPTPVPERRAGRLRARRRPSSSWHWPAQKTRRAKRESRPACRRPRAWESEGTSLRCPTASPGTTSCLRAGRSSPTSGIEGQAASMRRSRDLKGRPKP